MPLALMRLAVVVILAVSAGLAAAAPAAEPLRTGAAAFGDWRSDAPGVQRLITPADLPPPFATRSAGNPSRTEERRDGQYPKAPPGFEVDLYARDLDRPRVVRVAPNGDVFVAESGAGRIRVFRTADAKGAAGEGATFAQGLQRPFGIAFPPGADPASVYVATPGAVLRYPYRNGDLNASGPPQTIARLPTGGSHWTRDLAFSPDGRTLYVSVGSASNVAEGAPAAVEAAPTGALWCAVNERDGLGDDLPPDYATRVTDGAFYGWPWFYIGAHEDPRHKGERPDLTGAVTVPDVLIQAHSAPLGIAFYDSGAFPAAYRGDAFVALHGSWNRTKRTGYKLVRLRMKDGQPTGVVEDFLTGFVNPDDSVWGRPVDVAVTKDGALLVSDDTGGALWRVRWTGRE